MTEADLEVPGWKAKLVEYPPRQGIQEEKQVGTWGEVGNESNNGIELIVCVDGSGAQWELEPGAQNRGALGAWTRAFDMWVVAASLGAIEST